jgi:methylthioribulose-1-phosphate dehydratase
MLTLLLPRDAQSFKISHQEMIKGVRKGGSGSTLRFFDTLEVPIIENTADEEDLTSGMAEVRCPLFNAREDRSSMRGRNLVCGGN